MCFKIPLAFEPLPTLLGLGSRCILSQVTPQNPQPGPFLPAPCSFPSLRNFPPATHTVPFLGPIQAGLGGGGVCLLLSRSPQRELGAWGCGSRLWGPHLNRPPPQARTSLAADYCIFNPKINHRSWSLGQGCGLASKIGQFGGSGVLHEGHDWWEP